VSRKAVVNGPSGAPWACCQPGFGRRRLPAGPGARALPGWRLRPASRAYTRTRATLSFCR